MMIYTDFAKVKPMPILEITSFPIRSIEGKDIKAVYRWAKGQQPPSMYVFDCDYIEVMTKKNQMKGTFFDERHPSFQPIIDYWVSQGNVVINVEQH